MCTSRLGVGWCCGHLRRRRHLREEQSRLQSFCLFHQRSDKQKIVSMPSFKSCAWGDPERASKHPRPGAVTPSKATLLRRRPTAGSDRWYGEEPCPGWQTRPRFVFVPTFFPSSQDRHMSAPAWPSGFASRRPLRSPATYVSTFGIKQVLFTHAGMKSRTLRPFLHHVGQD